MILACLVTIVVSCGKITHEGDSITSLGLDVSIAPHVTSTKGIVSGSSFPQNSTMGLFICKHEEGTPTQFVEYSAKYNNLQAQQTSSTPASPVWKYRYNGTGTQFSALFLLKPQTGEQAADFYAYAPWTSGVTRPTGIPFNLQTSYGSLPDLMYAPENDTDINKNKIPSGDTLRIRYHFEHKLAWLRCKFYLKNDDGDGSLGPGSSSGSQNACTVNSIMIRRKAGAVTPLYVSGRFNGIKGTFTDESGGSTLVASDSLKVTYGYTFGTKGNTYELLLCPVEYQADGDYELVFTIDGKRLETKYSVKLSDLTHTGGTGAGFQEGYRYTFIFTYDNYQHIRLSGTQIDTDADWTDFPEQKEIVI